MSPRAYLRWPLAGLLLCELARPAFADGSIPTQEQMNRFLITGAIVIVLAIVVLILLLRAIFIALRKREERAAERANPPVPVARVVQDRRKPS